MPPAPDPQDPNEVPAEALAEHLANQATPDPGPENAVTPTEPADPADPPNPADPAQPFDKTPNQAPEEQKKTQTPSDPQASAPVSPALLQWADRHRWWLLVAISLIYLAGFNGQWRMSPDSSAFIIKAGNLMASADSAGGNSRYKSDNPGIIFLIAANFRLFGHDRFFSIQVCMFILAIATLGLIFWWLKLCFDRPTAVLVTCLIALTETFYRYGFELLADMPFLLGVMLFLIAYEYLRSKPRQMIVGLILAALATMVMALFRSVVLTFVAAVLLDVFIQLIRGPYRWRYAGLAAVVIVSLLVVRTFNQTQNSDERNSRDERVAKVQLGARLPRTLKRSITENIPRLLTETTSEAAFAIDAGKIASVPLSLAVLAFGLALVIRRRLWALLILAFFAQWALFISAVRYFLVIIPLLAVGWWLAGGWLNRFATGRNKVVLGASLIILWLAPNLFYVGRYIVEQRRVPFIETYHKGRYVPIVALGDMIKKHTDARDYVIADHQALLRYLGDRRIIGEFNIRRNPRSHKKVIEDLKRANRLWIVLPLGEPLTDRTALLPVTIGKAIDTIRNKDGRTIFTLHELSLDQPPQGQKPEPQRPNPKRPNPKRPKPKQSKRGFD